MRIRVWLEKNENVLKATAAIIVGIATATWTVIELIYPDVIQPRFQAGKLQTEIRELEVGRTEQYTVHQLTFTLTNNGLNRIYLPSSYFLVKAHRIGRVGAKKEVPANEEGKKKSEKLSRAVQDMFKAMSKDERQTLQAQASNFVIKNRWTDLLTKDGLTGVVDLRSAFDFDPESFLYAHLGRLTGLNEFLDPGDVTESRVLVFIPLGYQALEIISSTMFSKDKEVFSKYAFVGVPDDKKGLLVIVLDRSKPLDTQTSNLKEVVKENLNSDFYDRVDVELRAAEVITERKRVQVLISPFQQQAGDKLR